MGELKSGTLKDMALAVVGRRAVSSAAVTACNGSRVSQLSSTTACFNKGGSSGHHGSSGPPCGTRGHTSESADKTEIGEHQNGPRARDMVNSYTGVKTCGSSELSETPKPTSASIRERNITVTSYYNQQAIDRAAAKPSVRLTPATIMYADNSSKNIGIMRSAQYLHQELPIRIAHRVSAIRNLPFIVGCNPEILAVHELYIRAFTILSQIPAIVTKADEERYSQILRELLEDHKDVVSNLAKGFKEARKHIKDEEVIRRYLDKNLTSRLGIRMLATHHLLLKEPSPDHIGIISIRLSLKRVIEKWATFAQQLAIQRYGHAPDIRISGHINASFPYIEMPLEYLLPELFKNSIRATIEKNPGQRDKSLPPIYVTICNNEEEFVVKISDRGGGISKDRLNHIMMYSFTTADESQDALMEDDVLGNMLESMNQTTSGPMHGYGFGLPTSRAYAEYLGGSLSIQSMQGLGTDVYLRLRHFHSKSGAPPFRI